jgi:DNA-binding MarR family transcriptional regulator
LFHLCQHGEVTTPPEPDYRALLAFRTALRRFHRWSEMQAESAGLTAAQHQLLLAVKGHEDPRGPTIGDLADYLLLRHHSAVELVNRAQSAELVTRTKDPADRRVVRLRLTPTGDRAIETLTQLHLDELRQLEPLLRHVAQGADDAHALPLSRSGTA